MESYAAKRPNLEQWGMNSDVWCGLVSLPGSKVRKSPFALALEAGRGGGNGGGKGVDEKSFTKTQSHGLRGGSGGNGNGRGNGNGGSGGGSSGSGGEGYDVETGLVFSERTKNDSIALSVYGDHCSERAEAEMLYADVKLYITRYQPAFNQMDVGVVSGRKFATAEAIQTRLMVGVDGKPLPLTWKVRGFRGREEVGWWFRVMICCAWLFVCGY
jgi:hypothetical protein